MDIFLQMGMTMDFIPNFLIVFGPDIFLWIASGHFLMDMELRAGHFLTDGG